ncbi:MAG TPA: hypothetical protein VGN97_01260 [Mesorhizobium sp.]|jgi:hypothetical protein|nr:hypothetical protein [Mesorhizobium sp.]
MWALNLLPVTGLILLSFCSAAVAELPPQYTRWADLQAITNRDEIAQKLRDPVERIEAQGSGTYRVQAGACHLLVRISREGQTQGGVPVAGPSVCPLSGFLRQLAG